MRTSYTSAARAALVAVTTLCFMASPAARAQTGGNDLGVDFSVGLEKKIARGLEADFEASARTQDNSRRMERFTLGTGMGLKVLNTTTFDIKTSLKWEYMWRRKISETKTHYDENEVFDGTSTIIMREYDGYNEETAYWRNRHRTQLSVAATYEPNKRWRFQIKETAQYTHDAADSTLERKYRVNGDGDIYLKNTEYDYKPSRDRFELCSKITVQYDVRNCKLDPYVSAEYCFGLNYKSHKRKFTAGTEYKINKKNKLDFFYRFQKEDGDAPDGHLIGLGFKTDI